MKLIRITDNGGKTLDRYTAFFSDNYILCMSYNCLSPQGVCMSDSGQDFYEGGRTIELKDCPDDVQLAILNFIES